MCECLLHEMSKYLPSWSSNICHFIIFSLKDLPTLATVSVAAMLIHILIEQVPQSRQADVLAERPVRWIDFHQNNVSYLS